MASTNYIDILKETIEDDLCPIESGILQNPLFFSKLASGFIKQSEDILHLRKAYEDAAEAIMKLSAALDESGFKGELE